MARHPIKTLTATLALAALGACSSDKPPEAPKEVEAAPEVKPRPPVERTFDRDGVLARADAEVFNSPLPVESYTTTAGNRWAGYQNRHGYWDVIRFYEKNLGNRYELQQHLGGAKLTPKSGQGPEIYIPKPRKAGEATRVYYFGGDASDIPAPPFIKNPAGGGSTRLASGGGKPSGDPIGGNDPAPEGKNYVESVRTRPDGSQFIVMSPNPETNGDPRRDNAPSRGNRGDGRGDSNKPFAGTRKINIPEGTLY